MSRQQIDTCKSSVKDSKTSLYGDTSSAVNLDSRFTIELENTLCYGSEAAVNGETESAIQIDTTLCDGNEKAVNGHTTFGIDEFMVVVTQLFLATQDL